jgi:hypothetical protein
MKALLHLFVNLYPRWWRERYGDEFHALLEDNGRATVSSAVNVLTGALLMQLRALAEGPLDDLHGMELPAGNCWLLAFSGAVQAAIAAVYLVMQSSSRPFSFHTWGRTVLYLGYLELAAGMSAAAAGLLNPKNHKSWLLVWNGLAFIGLGFIHSALMRYPIRFNTLATLVMLMAVTVGRLALRIARNLRTRELIAEGRIAALAAIPATGFFAVFLALSARWIPMPPGSRTDLLWFGLYFAFSAICMVGAARRAAPAPSKQ